MGARLLVYDRTCKSRFAGLSRVWSLGAHLYRGLARIDDARGVASWDEALDWLSAYDGPIREIQYWGHGKWGAALVDRDVLDARSLARTHRHRAKLDAISTRLVPNALVWFRTCSTFGATPGIDFAERLADILGARVAGHTFIIAYHQSGLQGLLPGGRAHWSREEGLAGGSAEAPERALVSHPFAPRTITCLQGRVPEAWFSSVG